MNNNSNFPHTLPSLQREAARLYGYTPVRTYEIATDLYECGLISYPRTDCQYLPLCCYGPAKKLIISINSACGRKRFNPEAKSAAWDDLKVTSHHAIIPSTASALVLMAIAASDDKNNIYQLVYNRFVNMFDQPAPYEDILPRSYGDCDCPCHRDATVTHATPCCTLD